MNLIPFETWVDSLPNAEGFEGGTPDALYNFIQNRGGLTGLDYQSKNLRYPYLAVEPITRVLYVSSGGGNAWLSHFGVKADGTPIVSAHMTGMTGAQVQNILTRHGVSTNGMIYLPASVAASAPDFTRPDTWSDSVGDALSSGAGVALVGAGLVALAASGAGLVSAATVGSETVTASELLTLAAESEIAGGAAAAAEWEAALSAYGAEMGAAYGELSVAELAAMTSAQQSGLTFASVLEAAQKVPTQIFKGGVSLPSMSNIPLPTLQQAIGAGTAIYRVVNPTTPAPTRSPISPVRAMNPPSVVPVNQAGFGLNLTPEQKDFILYALGIAGVIGLAIASRNK